MKRILIFLLILLLLPLWGCREVPEEVEIEKPVSVYYKLANPTHGTEDSVIAATSIESKDHEADYFYLISLYLKGTADPNFERTFPRGTTLISFKQDALTGKIVLSDRFASLSGIDLTIACVCITRTVMELTGCREVIISTNTAKLNGERYITLSADSYLLLDSVSGEH